MSHHDQPEPLQLDPHTEDAFRRYLDHEKLAGRYSFDRGEVLKVPDHNPLFNKLTQYIDMDQGGLKILEVQLNGGKATFSVIPRVRLGGPKGPNGTIGIGFRMEF